MACSVPFVACFARSDGLHVVENASELQSSRRVKFNTRRLTQTRGSLVFWLFCNRALRSSLRSVDLCGSLRGLQRSPEAKPWIRPRVNTGAPCFFLAAAKRRAMSRRKTCAKLGVFHHTKLQFGPKLQRGIPRILYRNTLQQVSYIEWLPCRLAAVQWPPKENTPHELLLGTLPLRTPDVSTCHTPVRVEVEVVEVVPGGVSERAPR